MIVELILVCLAAYLIGSIPFGLLLTRAAGLGDIRAIGSGNIGATNVLRTGNKKLAALTLLLDGAKGLISVAVAFLSIALLPVFPGIIENTAEFDALIEQTTGTAALAAVLGHCFPIWLKFKGGKGVATTFGAALGLSASVGAAGLATWLVMAALFRLSSLAALVAIAALPVYAYFLDLGAYSLPLVIVALVVYWRHKENIKRLLAGTEPKIGKKS